VLGPSVEPDGWVEVDGLVVYPVIPEPVVDGVRLFAPLPFVPTPGVVWLVPAVGLFVDSLLVVPMVAPLAAELQGSPLAPMRPEVLGELPGAVPGELLVMPGAAGAPGLMALGLAAPSPL